MGKAIIRTPPGGCFSSGDTHGVVQWRSSFGADRTQVLAATQCFVDSEVLRCTDPYVPMRDGYLSKSGVLMTEIGSGEVNYGGPYAHRLYTHPAYNFDTSKHANAGGAWFEQMKINHADAILRGAKEKAGAK